MYSLQCSNNQVTPFGMVADPTNSSYEYSSDVKALPVYLKSLKCK